MEPLITIGYILSSFFGYYIGSDLYNSYKARKNHQETLNKFAVLEYKLATIESTIQSKLK
jgi:hypothetical protein